VRVYVVWVPRVPTEERFQVADEIVDERATHYWDNERRIEEHVAGPGNYGGAAYDYFHVYGPDAAWGDKPKATGAPVISEASKLEEALQPYVN
jgi:hypothetical protein